MKADQPEHTADLIAEEVQQFMEADHSVSDLRAHAPRLDRRLGALEQERDAIVTALLEFPGAGSGAVLSRIRALVKAENEAVFACYWHDLGGEGGA